MGTVLFDVWLAPRVVMNEEGQPTNRRAERRKEERRLLWAVLLFLVVGGGLVIALAYGPRAVALGVTCLLAGAGILGLLWLILRIIERMAE
jgi:fatty acid desaturase